ncbi:MAG TPA: glycosyltransferase [Pyrinomonadaceae bacterium]|nr:glycosyltransferase [Pyrinomonadaceae bacterium]
MKVLHVLDTLYRGGTEMQALDVCRNAAANGLDVSVAVFGGGPLESEFENAGVPYYRLQRRLPVDPALVLKLRRIIKTEGFDIVHAHQAVDGLHAYLATIGTGVKRVLSFHGHYPDAKNRYAVNFLVPRSSANISCSKGLLPWLREQNVDASKNFHVIYNGVDPKRLQYDGPDLREELRLSADALLFGMVAHFYPAARKDQVTLCKAFASIANDIPNAHLIVVGRVVDGAQEKYDQCVEICRTAGVLDRVHFLGQRDDLAKIVDGLDIYVFSSLHEGLPISLMEAMLSKKATILSDIEPHMEVSFDGKYAMTFETQNAADLAQKMLLLANDENVRFELAEKAFGFATETFSIAAHLKNLKDLYNSVLDR